MFEDTTELIINRKLTDNAMLKIERTKAQTQMYKVLNRQLNLEPCKSHIKLRVSRVCRYQRGNYNPHIEEEQTTQWPKKKIETNKQRSTKYVHKTKDRVARTQLKSGCILGCSGRVNSSWFTSGTRRVKIVKLSNITEFLIGTTSSGISTEICILYMQVLLEYWYI